MRVSLTDDIEGLTQRLQLLKTLDDPSTVLVLNKQQPAEPALPATRKDPMRTVKMDVILESQREFKQLDAAFLNFEERRAQRREHLRAQEEKRRAEAEAALVAAENKRQEEAKRAEEARKAELQRHKKEKELKEAQAKKEAEEKAAKQQKEEQERAQKEAAAKEAEEKAAQEKATKDAQERAAQQAQERAAKDAQAAAAASQQQSATASTPGAVSVSSGAEQDYEENMKVIQRAKTVINPQVSANKQLKAQCYELKITCKQKLGQLTHSKSHLMESLKHIRQVFDTAKGFGELGYHWVLNQFAKLVVQQAEGESRVDGASAVPVSMLVTLLWADHRDLGEYLIARFVKKDPFVIGYWCSIDTEQGRKRMGYRRLENNTWEPESVYGERIGGITSVWAVITQSKMSIKSDNPHPYPITHSWTFLARNLNQPTSQITDAHFCAVAAWWDVAGERFLEAFGRQADKLLRCASGDWVQASSDRRYPAANRLRLLGQDWQKDGKITPIWKPLGP